MPFENSWKRIGLEAGVVVLLGALLVWGLWALPGKVAVAAVDGLPRSVDQKVGAAAAAVMEKTMPECTEPRVAAAVGALTRLLTAQAPGMTPPHLRVVQSDEANAFALPGGHVFVLEGLLAKVERPEELAGVLAHELGHVELRHSMRGLARSVGVTLALTAFLGDFDALTTAFIAGADQLTTLSFSREQEAEADAFAVELMAKAGMDPMALGPFLERLQEGPTPPSFLLDHPASEDRREAMAALAKAQPTAAPAKLDPSLLADLKAPCVAKELPAGLPADAGTPRETESR